MRRQLCVLSALVVLLGSGGAPVWAKSKRKAMKQARLTAQIIDARIDMAMRKQSLEPGPEAHGDEVLRRLSLDLNGAVPYVKTVQNYRKFKSRKKLETLINKLIDSPAFARHMAEQLSRSWLKQRDRRRSQSLRVWLARQIQLRRPMNEVVQDIVLGRGRVKSKNSPDYLNYPNFFVDGFKPADKAAQASEAFLGVQIGCARCHDHPFNDWKQDQFHEFAAFFAPSKYVYQDERTGKVKTYTGRFPVKVERKARKYSFLPDAKGRRMRSSKLDQVADWLTHPNNPYFARAFVNRVFKFLFGRALIEPVDDIYQQSSPHSFLLHMLAEDFKEHDYSLRHLVRSLVLTRAYQRSSKRTDPRRDPTVDLGRAKASGDRAAIERAAVKVQQELSLFARASVRPLNATQIVDSLLRVTGQEAGSSNRLPNNPFMMPGLLLSQNRESLIRDFEKLFSDKGIPDEFTGGVMTSLVLFNGKLVNEALNGRNNLFIQKLIRGTSSRRKKIERIFLVVLSRSPTDLEMRVFNKIFSESMTVQDCEDLIWALINSSDFLLNH